MTASRLVIWRHGNTDWNRERRVQGHSDIPLNPLGLRQAATAAPMLAALRPAAVVSSDLARARQTADALAERAGLAVTTDPRLRERHFGRWQGRTMPEVIDAHPHEHARWVAGDPDPGCEIEPRDRLLARGRTAFAAAADLVSDGAVVVVVTHGGTAKHGVGGLLGWPDELVPTLGGLGNCRWTVLERRVAGWRLAAYNVGPSVLAEPAIIATERPDAG
ncbi:histidine phosphatase family protein [Pilimelia columellifera]|uniref:Histidine phosphatase family protein n=1 Tax=Pilimelia columellifera subsp. columellifera TaxID=706583 RepID=A0ABN3NNJ6_9ACTN